MLKHGVYWCIYACIWRMVVCCESSTYQVYHGVVSVPIYQSNDIVGSLITIVSYVITKQTTLTRVFCSVKLTDSIRLVGTYHGRRMYVFGLVRSRQRDKAKGNRAGVVCPAGCIDNGGFVPS